MITGNINPLVTIQNRETESASAIKRTANKDLTKATDTELMGACKEFEAYFLEQMMKAMWKTLPVSEETDAASGTLKDYYREEMFRELASESTEKEGLGLARMLYDQMKRNYEE